MYGSLCMEEKLYTTHTFHSLYSFHSLTLNENFAAKQKENKLLKCHYHIISMNNMQECELYWYIVDHHYQPPTHRPDINPFQSSVFISIHFLIEAAICWFRSQFIMVTKEIENDWKTKMEWISSHRPNETYVKMMKYSKIFVSYGILLLFLIILSVVW